MAKSLVFRASTKLPNVQVEDNQVEDINYGESPAQHIRDGPSEHNKPPYNHPTALWLEFEP